MKEIYLLRLNQKYLHALPAYSKSTGFVLNVKRKSIVDGEFCKRLSRKKEKEAVLEHLKLQKLHTLKFDNYVTQHLQIKNHFYLTHGYGINHV